MPEPCRSCGRELPLSGQGLCRLCRAQLLMTRHQAPAADVQEANRHGQQLFIVDLFRRNGQRYVRRPRPPAPTAEDAARALRPVEHRQPVLFDIRRDLTAVMARPFPLGATSAFEAAVLHHVDVHAAAHGWSRSVIEAHRRAVRVLLATQDTPGAPIRASDVMTLSSVGLPMRGTKEVLAAAGLLEDDDVPALVRWYRLQTADLPALMRAELDTWLNQLRHGSTTAPRSRPRAEATIRNQLYWALPTLRGWAADHASLREISRDDVLAALPPGGVERSCTLQGLRSIFKVLKGRGLTFINPTRRIQLPRPVPEAPAAVDLSALRTVLDGEDVTAAALAALLAYHAVREWQLLQMQLTDLRDGRLHLDEQVILLAEPVRERLAAYLDFRQQRWPHTANPHVFIHYRNATTTQPATPWWVRRRLGMPAQSIRQDRILAEAYATGGDVRRLVDLFGFCVVGAYRYTTHVQQTALEPQP
jgi:hypothetical protein